MMNENEWPSQEDLQTRYEYAKKKQREANWAGQPEASLFYAGQLSVLGLFVDEDD